MDKFIVTGHMPLEGASKTRARNGEPVSETNPSEWAVAHAMQKFAVGQEITEEEFYEQLSLSVIQQHLDSLVVKGKIEAVYDPDQDDIVYRAKQ